MPQVIHALRTPLLIALVRTVAEAAREARRQLARRRHARRTLDALNALDDATLRDLALHRSEITSLVAHPDDPHRVRVMRSIYAGR